MLVLIDTSTKSITFDQELRGDRLRQSLDKLFPNDEWNQYLVKFNKDLQAVYPIVQITKADTDRGLFPWNAGYTIRKANQGFMSANVKASQSNTSLTVDVSKATININIPITFTVEL